MNAPLNPSTLTLKQQGWEKDYQTLQQYRDAQLAMVNGLKEKSTEGIQLSSTEQNRLNDAKFNYLEAERQMINFKSDRYTAIDNDRAQVQWVLDHPPQGQTALQQQQAQYWIGQYDQASLELSQWQPSTLKPIPYSEESINNTIYNNLGTIRWDPNTLTGKLMYGYEQVTEFAGGALGGVQKLIELPDTMLTDDEKYNLCKTLSGLVGGFFGGKMLTAGLGLPNATGVMDILKGSVNPTSPQQMMSDTLKMGTGWAFKVEAGTGACKVYLPKSDMFGLGLVTANEPLTADIYAFTFTADLVQQVIAEEAASDAAMRMMSQSGGSVSAPLLLAFAEQAYNDTYSDYAVDPAATWNGWLTGRTAAQQEVLNDLGSLGQWQPDVLSLNQYGLNGMWQSNAGTTTEGSGSTIDSFTAGSNTTNTPQQTGATDPTTAPNADNSTLYNDGTYSIEGVGDVNAATGNQQAANAILSDDFQPGANQVLDFGAWANGGMDYLDFQFVDYQGAYTNQQATGASLWTPVDPLILDLNGDGVKLTSFADAPVLFDIDHDATGSKEITGWVSKEDGIVVMDLNGNGQIDGIHETMSEYFNGEVGAGGTAGTKPYANGFAALKSLDSNADNAFTNADTAWTNVKVWTDANHDGLTDTGELKTLDELGITAINLTPTTQSGLVSGGNEILASGTFTQNGFTREVQAARFIANPTGNTATVGATGTTVSAEDGQSTYVSSVTTGETIDVATIVAGGVKNAYGNSGNDTLIGDAGANWLVGGQGGDTFDAGAGDDMLIIDAADQQANIHAGDGFDMVQVVGSEGVTLNLAQADVEVAVGGTGDDILIGGGRSSVFIRAGDGDDILIGGAANDALSGENGADLIDGGAGNDVIRGGRGQDQLMGGAGDDLIEGGLDDDRLAGGIGNDVLKGGQGDDTLDAGEGIDVAQYSGSFADYRITRLTDSSYRIVDTKAGRDGADMLTNIEKLSFADVSAVDITLDNPFPVKDVLTIADRVGVKLIKVADLLANDRDWQGDQLHIATISDIKGGTIVGTWNAATQEWTPTLTANNELQFTPDPAYTGVMSFKYKIADADGTPGATAYIAGTEIAAEMRGQVFIKTPEMPSDSLFTDEWYLNDINVLPVWNDAYGQGYTGKNVKIAQFEPGMPFATGAEVFDYRHPDLQANADAAWISDPNAAIPQSFSQHATLVAGVMVAARDGQGAVGVAYDAKLSGHYIQGTGLEESAMNQEVTNALAQFKNYDVVNNSWGSTIDFGINVIPVGLLQQGILDAVNQGRNGLGTAIVMAGGNDRANGGNTNANALTANRAVIVTGAINAQGDISTLTIGQAPFSNPGASILVSAPGSNVASTSRILMNDDGTVFGNDTATTQGTSFATPIVSGIVALMLEANPNLGWRDVQQILALTARQVNDPNTDTVWNFATNWNGGGMHASHDYGFGDVDARAAVRLAETWTGSHTSYNERHLANGEGSLNGGANLGVAINDGAVITRTLSLGAGLRAEHATVSLDVTHSNWGDLTVELISPTGTISKLVANPGTSSTNPGGDVGTGQLTFALDTTHDYGENAQGNWQLRITDRSGRGTGTLNGWKVDVYGSDLNETFDSRDNVTGAAPVISATADNSYFFTDEFASAPGAARSTLNDTNGGKDFLNAAAVSAGSTINLNNGTTSTIAGRSLTINGDVEHAYGGDGNDTITGNAMSNRLSGGRGNDALSGGDSMDLLDGGQGNDTLTGGNGNDFFLIRQGANSVDTITDFTPGTVGEKILLVGFDGVTDFSQIGVVQEGANTRLNLGSGQSVLLQNVAPTQISEQNFGFFTDMDTLETYAKYMSNTSIYWGSAGVENGLLPNNLGDMRYFALGGNDVIGAITSNDLIDGGDGGDTIWGDYAGTAVPGADWLEGGAGNDFLYGGAGDDLLLGGSGNDNLQGEAGNDVLRGATGADVLLGGDGNDVLLGGAGDDFIDAGTGDDVLFMEGDWGTVNGTTYSYYGTRVGGAGADTFVVTPNGGGNGSLSASGGSVSAYNMIADFDPNQAGEGIDLTNLKWIRGFGDLSIQSMNINGTSFARVTATDGINQLGLTLRGVSGSALNASHFKINPNPGLIIGSSYSDTLTGDAGGNTVDGGLGADAMTGRTGDDTYIVDNAGDTVIELPDGGFDTVKASVTHTLAANVENLVLTGASAINGTGNDQANRLTGNSADNVLDGGAGADALLGGAGDDSYIVDNQSDTVIERAGEGMDTVQSSVSYTLGNEIENLTLTGTAAINATGNSLVNILTGNAGDNILDGAAGADTMAGGVGDDTYLMDDTGDVVTENANEGIDTVYASVTATLGANVENLVLAYGATSGTGNALDNSLLGNGAANILTGGAGNDVLDGGAGADTLVGGTGDDTYVVDSAGDVVTELADEGDDTIVASVSIDLTTLPNVENVVLTGTTDINATGNASGNRLVGNAGNNALAGAGGADTLDGGAGADAMAGGSGDDVYVVDNAGDGVTEGAGEGTDAVFSSVGWTLGSNVENLTLTGGGAINGTGNSLDNTLTGNWNANVLDGGVGNDTLDGGGGTDTLVGGDGSDTYMFSVGGGADTIVDASGVDQLHFGAGILASAVTVSRSGSLVTLAVSATDCVSFDETAPGQYAVESVVFADGTVWQAADIQAMANSAPTGMIGLDGTATQGQTLAAVNGLVDADGLGAAAYQWQASADGTTWIDIVGATADSFTLGEAQVGQQVRTVASYTDAHGTAESVVSSATAAVANLNDAPTGIVGVGGTAIQGEILTASNTLADADGLSVVAYQWQSSADGTTWNDIAGATADSFTLGEAQIGQQVRAVASYTDGHGTAESMASSPSAAVTGYQAGSSSNDGLVGTNFSDILLGLDGNDALDGGAGDDTLDGGTGADVMLGGSGDDSFVVDDTGDVVTENANSGTDTVQSSITYTLGANVENLTLTGTSAINGTGNSLANTLTGNSAANILSGGTGNDLYVIDDTGDVVIENANSGTDTVQSSITYTLGANVENLTLTGASDINGFGNSLANTLTGNSAANILSGGAGNDVYVIGDAGDVVVENLYSGTDTVKSSITYTLGANVENLTLTGTSAIDGTGNALMNYLTGNSAANTLIGGAGDDNYMGIDDADVVIEYANGGTDSIWTSMSYTLGSNFEVLRLTGTDPVNGTGNALNNNLFGNSAANTLIGGLGNDGYWVNRLDDVVIENANEGIDTVNATVSWVLGANFENLSLLNATFDVTGTGNELNNSLVGGFWNNILDGGLGADRLDGRAGNDTYVVDNIGDIVVESAGMGMDTVLSSISYALAINVENLSLTGTAAINGTGNTLNNVLIGNAGANVLAGVAGNDTLNGGLGNDAYAFGGGGGSDTVVENDATVGNLDAAQFSAGIATDQLWFRHVNNNLEVSIIGTSDKLTIQDWYSGSAYHLEQFRTADDQLLLDTQVENLVQAMAAFTPPSAGQTTLPQSYQDALAPVIAANWQ